MVMKINKHFRGTRQRISVLKYKCDGFNVKGHMFQNIALFHSVMVKLISEISALENITDHSLKISHCATCELLARQLGVTKYQKKQSQ